MTFEAYFWIFCAVLAGFNLGAWAERQSEPEPIEIVEQACVDELFLPDRHLKFEGLSSEMKRDDI